MRKSIYLFLLLCLGTITAFAQNSNLVDKGFSYQGYARDAGGAALGNQDVTVKFSVSVHGSSTIVFSEEHNLTTDPFGVFHAIIGSVNTTDYRALAFGYNNYQMKIEVKTPATNYVEIGNAELLAVPYAKAAANGNPVGTVLPFMGARDKVPDGYLVCDGALYDPVLYPALAAVIGTSFDDDNTQHMLPDLRGQFLRGWHDNHPDADLDQGDRVGGISNSGGVGSRQAENIIAHTHNGHTNITGDHNHNVPNTGNITSIGLAFSDGTTTAVDLDNTTGQLNLGATRPMNNNGAHQHSFTTDSHGGFENRPKNIAVLYIIKY